MQWAWECLLPNEKQNNKKDSRGGAEDAELTTQ